LRLGGNEPDRIMLCRTPSANRLADRGGTGRCADRTRRGLPTVRTSGPVTVSQGNSMLRSVLIRHCSANAAASSGKPIIRFRQRMRQPDIERANRFLPELLAREGWNPRSPTASSMALVGSGRLRLLPLAATGQPELSSPGLRPFLAKQESPFCPVLHCVAALRVQRCKPLPSTSHRDRE
jgi:hypothetical protein